MKKCPKCEKVMSDDSAFCDKCGTSLAEVEPETEILDTVSTVPPIKEEEKTEELELNTSVTEYEIVSETETTPETEPETVPETEPETVPETVPETKPEKKKTKRIKAKKATATVPATVPETEPVMIVEETLEETSTPETEVETVPETVPKTIPETIPETVPETTPVTTPITVPATEAPTVPVIIPATVPEIVPVTIPQIQVTPTLEPEVVQKPIDISASLEKIKIDSTDVVNDVRATVSLILGITSLVFCGLLPIAGVGLLMAFLADKESKQKIPALVLNFVSVIVGIISLVIFMDVLSAPKEVDSGTGKLFYGDGYTLKYDSNWKTAMLDGDRAALKYNSEDSYFVQVGQSSLDDTVECDFQKAACKTTVYNDFYSYWSEDIDETLTLTKDSSFIPLKDDIFYATYNYKLNKSGELRGKYYLVISKDKNAVLSFVSNANEDNLAILNPAIINLLKSIKIDKKEVIDDTIGQSLEKQSSWNQYSDLRKDALGSKKTIYGEYRILSDSSSYWVFKSGEFYWYKSEADKKDNYWYGKTTIKTGKQAMRLVGLEESKLNDILDQSNGKVYASDVYGIKMTPKKIISGGEDKSDTNIPEGTEWKFVWILVDHGEEGIEAQVLNVDTSDTSFFVKVKD